MAKQVWRERTIAGGGERLSGLGPTAAVSCETVEEEGGRSGLAAPAVKVVGESCGHRRRRKVSLKR